MNGWSLFKFELKVELIKLKKGMKEWGAVACIEIPLYSLCIDTTGSKLNRVFGLGTGMGF